MKKAFVTGGAGFIGSTLVDRLAQDSRREVVVYDNFSTGLEQFLAHARKAANVTVVRGDLLDTQQLTQSMQGCDFVFHLAANADVRFGTDHPRKDLEQNTIVTFHVLEAMRQNGIRRISLKIGLEQSLPTKGKGYQIFTIEKTAVLFI